jgi:hypothetical protein
MTVLLSHAGDDAAGVTWSWHDVDASRRCQAAHRDVRICPGTKHNGE